MHSFNSDEQSAFHLISRGQENDKNGGCVAHDLEELGIHHLDSADISKICWMYNGMKASNVSVMTGSLQFGGFPDSFGSAGTGSSDVAVERGQFMLSGSGGGGGGNGGLENCRVVAYHKETAVADKDELAGVHHQRLIAADSTQQSKGGIRDQKALVKLAQNREAARKSRMRKKAYLQHLEMSQQRITELDEALRRARHQVASGTLSHSVGGRGFETDHARWLGEHQRLNDDLRSALLSCDEDEDEDELHLLVDAVFSHYGNLFRIKSAGARSDMFHILSGTWRSPAERCLMWLGGFRSSDLLKVLEEQIQPLSEQQLVGICNLQQSCHQTEDALSQGMEALQQSLLDTLSSTSLAHRVSGNAVDYATKMAFAMTIIEKIEKFLNQADLLRLHTLQQLQRILTTRQAARALLAINDYKTRLRALSSLWLARPKE